MEVDKHRSQAEMIKEVLTALRKRIDDGLLVECRLDERFGLVEIPSMDLVTRRVRDGTYTVDLHLEFYDPAKDQLKGKNK